MGGGGGCLVPAGDAGENCRSGREVVTMALCDGVEKEASVAGGDMQVLLAMGDGGGEV